MTLVDITESTGTACDEDAGAAATEATSVQLNVADTTLRLALSFVLDDAGYRRTHEPDEADVAVSTIVPPDRPRAAVPTILLVPPFPAPALAAVKAVARGTVQAVLSADDPLRLPKTVEAVLDEMSVVPRSIIDAANQAPDLEQRLDQTLRLVLTGSSNRVIARRLGQSESTVKRDVAELFRAFDAPNRTALVSMAARLGYAAR